MLTKYVLITLHDSDLPDIVYGMFDTYDSAADWAIEKNIRAFVIKAVESK